MPAVLHNNIAMVRAYGIVRYRENFFEGTQLAFRQGVAGPVRPHPLGRPVASSVRYHLRMFPKLHGREDNSQSPALRSSVFCHVRDVFGNWDQRQDQKKMASMAHAGAGFHLSSSGLLRPYVLRISYSTIFLQRVCQRLSHPLL